ncbi:MAG: hypothetical protein HUU02_09270 [Bacteroidetes bacterium]|nr:hypothetical protein [Bacteroidota bacterium]
MMLRCTIILLSIAAFLQPLRAQYEHLYENWRWAHFTTKSGLPSNTIEGIVETKDRTPWVITPQGLAWYDGYQWKQVVLDTILPDRRIRQALPFKDGLIVNIGGRLWRGNQYGFQRMLLNSKVDSGFVSSICPTDHGTILCSVEYEHVSQLFSIGESSISMIPSPPPGKLFYTRSTIWLLGEGNDAKHHIYRYKDGTFQKVKAETGQPNAIRAIVENSSGVGVLAMDAPKGSIGLWEYRSDSDFKYSATERNQPVRCLDISEKDEVIVAYESGAIHMRIDYRWMNIKPISRQMQNILSVKYRDNGDLWIGTEDGLYLHKRGSSIWSQSQNDFSDVSNVVMELFRSSRGEVWTGTMDGVIVTDIDGRTRHLNTVNGRPLGLITGINEDGNGDIWIVSGAGFKGAYCWDGQSWKHYSFRSKDIGYHKIRKDNSGRLWFLGLGESAEDPAGYILDGRRMLRIDSIYSLPSNRVYAFQQSQEGILWFGTANGLVKISEMRTRIWDRDDLGKNPKVFTLAIDSTGSVWFSTFSALLARITPDDSLEWVWRNDELYNYQQKIWDLVVDSSNILWLATTKGLYSYSNEIWTNYNVRTGDPVRELRVVLPLQENVLVGGHGIGVRSMIRNKNSIPLIVSIMKPMIDQQTVHCSWNVASLWGAIPSEQIETRYKLEDAQWSEWSTIRDIVFSDLESGEHHFLVQAKDSFGNKVVVSNSVSFYVEPPVLMRPIFALPLLGMFIAIIVLLYRYRKAQRINALQILNQRTRIANDLHDEVGSNLASVALISARLLKDESLPDFVREQLSAIRETAAKTSDFLRDIVWYVNPRYDSFMSLETRLREIAGRMLQDQDVRIEMNNTGTADERFVESRRSIILMFKEIIHNIVKHAQASTVIIQCDYSRDEFLLNVKDNGVGFNPETTRYGSGLLSIKRRARETGAELNIRSNLGEGTTITIIFRTNATDL